MMVTTCREAADGGNSSFAALDAGEGESPGESLLASLGDLRKAKACQAFNPTNIVNTVRGIKQTIGSKIISKQILFGSIPGGALSGGTVTLADGTAKAIEEGSFFDPRDNVLFLRILAWAVWMFMLPFILWSTQAPPSWLPTAIQTKWYELCFYLHAVGAWVTVIAALYARFEVFFPIMYGH